MKWKLTSNFYHALSPGFPRWQSLLAPFHFLAGYSLCSPYWDSLELVPIHHASLQDLFAPQPLVPVLSVSVGKAVLRLRLWGGMSGNNKQPGFCRVVEGKAPQVVCVLCGTNVDI